MSQANPVPCSGLWTPLKNGNGNGKNSGGKQQGGLNQHKMKSCLGRQAKPGLSRRVRPRSPGWADLAPSVRGLPGRRGSSCTGPESCPHPFSDLQSAPLTSLCAMPEARRDRLRREARPHLPHPTDELRPGGLGGSGEVGVWLRPQISFGLYSQHGGQEDFFQPHLHIPFPKHVWFLFCCICKRRWELGTCLTPLG